LPAGYDKVKEKVAFINLGTQQNIKDKNSAGQSKPNEFTLIMDHSSIGLLKDMRC
jgi:hypothetical protein